MHIIETDILIDAEPAAVWATLTDRDHSHEWNPFIRRMDGDLSVGGKLTVEIGAPGQRSMRFRPTVTALEPDRQLAWVGRLVVRGLFDGEHSFTLQPIDGGRRTRLVHVERFSGLLVRFAHRMLGETASGFEEFNAALKHRVEQHVGAQQ
jgi:hypothetical protein